MKVKSLVLSAATAVIVPVVGLTGPALAAPVGQIEGGDIYRVRNVTKNTDFTDPASADLCETVQFKVRIHNPGPDTLNNVVVKATLDSGVATSHSSKVTITADNANPSSTTDTAGVNLSKAGSLNYVSGSTELLDAHNSKLKDLPDGILSGGVNIGSAGVSIEQKRFVQFKAKTNCPTPKPECKVNCVPPSTPPSTPPTPAAPTKLVNSGPGDAAAAFAAATVAGTMGYRLYLSRRLARQ
ncbi:MAG TPA: hypothetical protein VFX84_03385 [Candidatus Saccharimonadales bacterium]|nr:hypothetical protein [Candidatus Saccharimonadales bacterium]